MNASLRFAVICAGLTLLISALHQFTFEWVSRKTTAPSYLLVYVFFGLMYWLSFHWITRAMNKSPRQFVNTFMMVSVLRMLTSLLILIPLLMKNKDSGLGKFIAIYFVVGYFVFLITEITVLFKFSKRKG